jgi:NAD(P)H-flavin reductase
MDNRDDYGEVIILYGAKTKEDIVFATELDEWSQRQQVKVFTTIDSGQNGWTGHVGVVTTLFDKIKYAFKYKTFVCGPPIMIHFTIKGLLDAGWAQQDIITTLERHMKCGVGKCGHCYIGGKYVCTDGPVFTYSQIDTLGIEV